MENRTPTPPPPRNTYSFLPTLWLLELQEISGLAVGNGHEVNRLHRRCSQSNLPVGRFLAGFWDLNEKVDPCRGNMSKFLGQNALSIVSNHT